MEDNGLFQLVIITVRERDVRCVCNVVVVIQYSLRKTKQQQLVLYTSKTNFTVTYIDINQKSLYSVTPKTQLNQKQSYTVFSLYFKIVNSDLHSTAHLRIMTSTINLHI